MPVWSLNATTPDVSPGLISRGMLLVLAALVMAPAGLSAQSLSDSDNPFAGNRFLPADEAFSFYTSLHSESTKNDTLIVTWDIAEGYYLYQDKFRFSVPQNSTEEWRLEHTLPAGVPHSDEFFGDVTVYYDSVSAEVDISDFKQDTLTLDLQFQGCSEAGLCYTLQTRRIQLEI